VGVSIHYRGRLNDATLLPALSEELDDIADAMGWHSTRLDDDWTKPANAQLVGNSNGGQINGHLGLKGIQITPRPKGESLSFFFDREGALRSPMSTVLILEGTLKPEHAWMSIKTQFLSPEIHIWIIGLLKYLKKRYISDLEVSDEGMYWETDDINVLRDKMDLIDAKIECISDELSVSRFGDVSSLSAAQIALRIERLLRDSKDGNSEQIDGEELGAADAPPGPSS
jgi:hypothetical protein